MFFLPGIRRAAPRFAALLTLMFALLACAGPPGDTPPSPTTAEVSVAPILPVMASVAPATTALRGPAPHPITAIARAGEAGSRVALGTLGTARLAFVADEDDHALHTIDIAAGVDVARTPLAATPSEVVIGIDGRVYVGLRSASAIAILGSTGVAGAPLVEEARLATGVEPVGLTLAPDGATLLVTTGISHELKAFSLASGRELFTVDLPREPRSLVVTADGARAFVAHAAGSTVSAVDLAAAAHPITSIDVAGALEPRRSYCAPPARRPEGAPPPKPVTYRSGNMPGVQGFGIVAVAGTILVPQVNAWSHDAQLTTPSYGPEQGVSEISRIAAIDAQKATLHADSVSIPGVQGEQCLLPRAVVKHPTRPSVLVACLGTDTVVEMMSSADGMTYQPISNQVWPVPAGPEGLAVDAESKTAVVFSQFARELTVLKLDEPTRFGATPAGRKPRSLALTPLVDGPSAAYQAGRRLFHAAGDRRISRDGRACASCHPDGRDDGLAWSTPHGLRQTPMLAGRAFDTAPYGWEGARSDLREHIVNTVAHRLVGTGLGDAELDALVTYVKELAGPTAPARPKSPAEARGEALFQSGEVGCARCHDGAARTDKQAHDIQSGGTFDTPSLRFVGGTAPYFHDGRYPTLSALLADTDGRMGHTGQLDEGELGDLQAYLRSL